MSNIIVKVANKMKNCNSASFYPNERGNVATIFALAALPVIMSAGMGIDYARSSDAKSLMQSAVDSAAIALVLDSSAGSCASKKTKVLNSITNLMNTKDWVSYNATDVTVSDGDTGGCTVAISGKVDTAIMAIAGFKTMDVSATATAIAGASKKLEIALALDNTGSMKDDMGSLRAAATNFVDTLFAKAGGSGQLKIGLIPFVAAVNPGKAFVDNSATADYKGLSPYHGHLFNNMSVRNATSIDAWAGCKYDVYSNGSASGVGSGGNSDKGAWLENIFGKSGAKFAYMANELIGIKTAHAQTAGGTTPVTDYAGMAATWKTSNTFKDNKGTGKDIRVMLPSTLSDTSTFHVDTITCHLINPPKVNHFDLFNRIQGQSLPGAGFQSASWKGCVEARPDPFDLTDDAPGADPKSLFVPYFYPSDPDTSATAINNSFPAGSYNNSYMPNAPIEPATYNGDAVADFALRSGFLRSISGGSAPDLFKYNLSVPPIKPLTAAAEKGPESWGPNRACPNAVTPLTTSQSTLQTEINGLTHWFGGGTITSEGLMWAWRVLSPNAPYGPNVASTLGSSYFGGAAYTDASTQKYIVLMTDGINNLQGNGPLDPSGKFPHEDNEVYSEYTAYGALWANYTIGKKNFAPGVPVTSGMYGAGSPPASGMGVANFDDARKLLDARLTTACTNAKATGIKIYTIYFSHGAADKHATDILTQCSGADNTFVATDSTGLQTAFNKIASSINIGNVRLIK
jgi:Flp pilus assembly protein TadG